MKKLLTTLSILTLATTTGNLSCVLNTTSQKNNIKTSMNDNKTQQDTIYIDKNGNKKTTNLEDLWRIEAEEVIQIGFFKNQIGNIQVVRMPKTIKKVPTKLPPEITSLARMFAGSKFFNQDLSQWDTSNIYVEYFLKTV